MRVGSSRKLEGILNFRDLSTVCNKVKPNKIIRTGCISKASDSDVSVILKDFHCRLILLDSLFTTRHWS